MSATAQEKPHIRHDPGTELFDQLGALLSRPKVLSMGTVRTEVKRSVRRFHAMRSEDEVAALRLIVQEVVAQIDQLATPDSSVAVSNEFNPEELARAAREDAHADAAMVMPHRRPA